ncbi:ATP-binding cassette domain-containing protein, partial [Candidatus Woesearchaeota archaeon]|nr:ATP-binding cassette domain-containing protein [Candidatus Woesearchaeota archaeon]
WYHKLKVMVIQSILLASLEFATIYFAVKLYNAGTITLGVIVLIQIYALTIFGSVWNLGRGIQKLSSHLSDMKEMVDIITLEPTVKDPIKPETVKIKKGQITFENVSFKYEKESILDDFNLEIKAGEKIGLVGISGSGKSTLTKLLLRFYDPTSGKIKIDDQDISKIKREHLRNEITYVPQEQLLFHRTLKENIAYSKKATDNEVIAASKKANAHEFISKLPKGYDTLVGERGIKLSGGERQRVAIARAILKEAPILIMDEATSSLDTLSEKYIQESTEKLMKNKTAIIIAHRLSTVQRLDRIIVLKKGKIVEQGTHKQLIEKKGEYYKLYQHQNL